jgi:hypothetical protein
VRAQRELGWKAGERTLQELIDLRRCDGMGWKDEVHQWASSTGMKDGAAAANAILVILVVAVIHCCGDARRGVCQPSGARTPLGFTPSTRTRRRLLLLGVCQPSGARRVHPVNEDEEETAAA